ncbi:MAG: phosphodiester glycosidase family protein [Treponema sp.]|jgi:exopolysaccharide biosynthesis protein|nr:phosphodiester glycosidase family protein [Treponema sp.]
MMINDKPVFSEFPFFQGLWRPRLIKDCKETLDFIRANNEVPIGTLFLCLIGTRDIENWFATGFNRPQIKCTIVNLDQPQSCVNGSEMLYAINGFLNLNNNDIKIYNWVQLCALILLSELCGAEVLCLWTNRAIKALYQAEKPEAWFVPWGSPAWTHNVKQEQCDVLGFDPYDTVLKRGLNPALIRRSTNDIQACNKLNASHFLYARNLLKKFRSIRSYDDYWKLDRYFGFDAISSSLGVVLETGRFRYNLFRWMHDSGYNTDEQFLIADALLHLREPTLFSAVSCNSFMFRWRTRNPFTYQKYTLGELYQILTLIGSKENQCRTSLLSNFPRWETRSAVVITNLKNRTVVETKLFQVSLNDGRIASGTIFKLPAKSSGLIYPDIYKAAELSPLTSIVKEYEYKTTKKILVAINGGYFIDNRTVQRDLKKRLGMPVGLLKYNENIFSGPFYSNRPVLCIDYDNNIFIQSVARGVMSQETGTLDQVYGWRDENEEYLDYRAVLEAGPFLIKKGEISIDLRGERWEDALARKMQAAPIEMTDLRTMRSSVAISESGDIYLTTVHGRIPESVGMTHEELALFLKREIKDVKFAMEMDAGGSVTAWHINLGVTTIGSCVSGHERAISTCLLFCVPDDDL